MKGMAILSLIILACYICGMWGRYGRQEVISEYAYKGDAWQFSLSIGLPAALLMPWMIERAPENFQFLGFLAPAALLFVAAAPHYKDEDSKVHKWAAIMAAVFCVMWGLAVNPGIPVMLAIIYALLYPLDEKGRWSNAELFGLAIPYLALVIRN